MSKIQKLKIDVCLANKELVQHGLVLFTWGNLSAYDRDLEVIAIKPSGIEYKTMTPDDIVVLDLDGNIISGELNPSSDTPTHLELYKAFPQINSIVHTHSTYATIYSQAQKPIPCYGTTHADSFYGEIPLVDHLSFDDIRANYEENTGTRIIESFKMKGICQIKCQLVYVLPRGPFVRTKY